MALAKKEEAVSSLRKQHEVGAAGAGPAGRPCLTAAPGARVLQAAVKRADHLEELLEQLRRPLRSAK